MRCPTPNRARIPRGHLCRLIAAMLFLAAHARVLAAQDRSPTRDPSPEVMKLSMRGVRSVDQHDLEKSISTQASKCVGLFVMPLCLFSRSPILWQKQYLDRDQLRLDVLRIRVYYWRSGFREAT